LVVVAVDDLVQVDDELVDHRAKPVEVDRRLVILADVDLRETDGSQIAYRYFFRTTYTR
jgi:hypothetical protein